MPQRLELELERSSIFDFFETISLCTNVRNIFQLVFNTGKGLRKNLVLVIYEDCLLYTSDAADEL